MWDRDPPAQPFKKRLAKTGAIFAGSIARIDKADINYEKLSFKRE